MALLITLLCGLLHAGLAAAAWLAARRLAAAAPGRTPPAAWPPVRVFLPFAGAADTLRPALDDLAAQDYPDYELRLACHAADAPAGALARAWLAGRPAGRGPRARLVTAETARGCSQKNANLLAALAESFPAEGVLVFTDADYRRPPDWLRRLVAPVASGVAPVSAGYYFAVPGRGWRGAWRPVAALLLFLTRQYPALRQPWGGATAISARCFEDCGVAALWAGCVVDDVALAVRLRARRLAVAGLNASALLAPPASGGVAGEGWWARQLAYLRALQPALWAGIGLGLLAVGAAWLWMAAMLARAPAAPVPAGLAAFDVALWAALGLRVRALHPCPGSRALWLATLFGFFLFAPACFVRTAFSRTIRWRGVCYRVGAGGRVLATSARPTRPPAAGPAPAPPRPT